MNDLAHAFDPNALAGTVVTIPKQQDDWRPIMPVPVDAPSIEGFKDADVLFRAIPQGVRDQGFKFENAWCYRDQGGNPLGYTVRVERPASDGRSEKKIYPVAFCEGPRGARRYFSKHFPEPRPLFNLHRLAERAALPVMVVEGEKTARAAEERFPGYWVTTSPAGSNAAHKADWSAVRGRDVTIVPDNDTPGLKYAEAVTRMAYEAGARTVRVVDLPDGLPLGWDLADEPPGGVTWADIEASAASAAIAAAPRPEGPLPLFQPLPPPEAFPVDTLGPLAPAAQAIANKIQVPLAIAAQSVLSAASLAAQSHADVRLPFGQVRPLSLFLATVAESGARKTSADNEALWPVYRREKALREIHTEDMKAWRIEYGAWSAEKKKIEAEKKTDFAARKEALAQLGSEPDKPLHPFLVTADMTPDGLTKNWGEAHPALGIFSAEGGVFTGSHGMSDDNKLRTAAMLSEAWDGKPIKRIRAMDGVTVLPGRRLAMHVMIQPDAAALFLADATLRDQGLLSRVLVSAPASIAGSRFYREVDPQDDAVIRAYGARILSILESTPRMAEGKRNELDPPALTISPEATKTWREFFDHVERMMGADEAVRGVQDFASKAAEHAARIAGVLTVYEDVRATGIDADAMGCAVELVSFYVGEALRLQAAGRTNPRLLLAQRLLDWLKGTGDRSVSFRDIITYGPGPLRTKDAADAAVAILVSHGWVKDEQRRPRTIEMTEEG